MLTVDYDRLGLRPGDLLLDLGCGFGRHAFEGLRRGARVVACDMAVAELVEVRSLFGAMAERRRGRARRLGARASTATPPACPFADDTFDRIIASEVMEHIPDDLAALDELARVLKPGGTIAVTVPAWLPEKVCWALSATSTTPPTSRAATCASTPRPSCAPKMRGAGLEPTAPPTTPTPCTRRTGG